MMSRMSTLNPQKRNFLTTVRMIKWVWHEEIVMVLLKESNLTCLIWLSLAQQCPGPGYGFKTQSPTRKSTHKSLIAGFRRKLQDSNSWPQCWEWNIPSTSKIYNFLKLTFNALFWWITYLSLFIRACVELYNACILLSRVSCVSASYPLTFVAGLVAITPIALFAPLRVESLTGGQKRAKWSQRNEFEAWNKINVLIGSSQIKYIYSYLWIHKHFAPVLILIIPSHKHSKPFWKIAFRTYV